MRDKLVQFWMNLTEPLDSVHGHETRQKARFIATLYVIMLPLGAVMMIWGLASAYPGNIITDNDFIVMFPAGLIWLGTYVLSKRGHFELATLISVGVAFIGIFLGNVLDTNPAIGEMSFLLFPILLSSLMLDHRITAILVGIALLLAGIFPFINPQVTFYEVLAGPITFLLIGSVMILISNYHRDRLERVRHEELGEYQDRARKMLASSYEGMCIIDDDTIVEANYALASMLGYIPEELVGMNVVDLSPPEARGKSARSLRELLDITNEVIASRKDGTRIYLELLPQQEESDGHSVDVVAVREITERKEAELALIEAEERYRIVVEDQTELINRYDLDGTLTFVNEAYARFYNKRPEDFIGKKHSSFVSGKNLKKMMKLREKLTAQSPSIESEYDHITPEGEVLRIRWTDRLVFDEEGNRTGYQAIGRDITAHKRAEEEIAKLRKAVQTSGEIIFMTDPEGIFTYINPEFTTQYGYSEHEVIGKATPSILKGGERTKDEYKDFWAQLLNKEIIKAEFCNKRKDGSLVDIETTMNAIVEEGEIVGFLAIQRDITSRKQAQIALQREKEKAQTYLQVAEVIFLALDQTGNITLVNKKGCEILGFPEEEIVGKNWFDAFLPAEAREQVRDNFKQIIAGEIDLLEYYENAVIARGGEERIIAWHNSVLKDDAGEIIGALSSGEDITERRQAELQLAKNQARYRAVVEDQEDLINRCDLDFTFTFVNEAYAEFHNKRPEELIGNNYDFLFQGEDLNVVLDSLRRLSKDAPAVFRGPVQTVRDGQEIWLYWSSKLICDDAGNPIEYQSIGRDITELKLAEKAMRESEARYRAVVEDQVDLINRYNLDGTITFVNAAYADFFGFDPSDVIGKTHAEFLDQDAVDSIRSLSRKLSSDNPVLVDEVKHDLPDGRVVWIHWSDRLIFDDDGNPVEFQGVGTDITDFKKAEKAIQDSEARYRAVVQDQVDLINRFTPDGKITFVNEAYASFFGREPADIIGKTHDAILHQRGIDKIKALCRELTPELPVIVDDVKHEFPDGRVYWMQWTNRLILDDKGHPIEIQGVGTDITDLKKAEKAIQASEARYRAVVEDQDDLINRYDLDGVITFVNDAYATFFDINTVDAVGKTHESFHSPENYAALLSVRDQLSPEKPVFTNEARQTFPDGREVWILWTTRLILDEDGKPFEYQGVGTDITYLKLVQEALSKKEQDYRSVFEGAHDAIVIITPDDETILDANQRAFEMYGYARDEFIGQCMKIVTKDVSRGKAEIARILEKRVTLHFETIHLDRHGREINVEINSSAIEYKGQAAIMGVIRDVTENVQTQKQLALQAVALARANALTNALTQVAAQISSTVDPDRVLETLGSELKLLDLDCSVSLLRSDGDVATIEYLSINSKLLNQIERLTGQNIQGFELPRSTWAPIAAKTEEENQPQFAPSFAEAIFPGFVHVVPEAILQRGLKSVGLSAEVPGLFLPFRVGDQITGILNIWGQDLLEEDLSTFSIFTSQLAAAYENARLYEAEQHQANELQRSNELVMTLSRVSAEVIATADPGFVFKTLGRELNTIGMHCTYTSVDKSAGVAVIEYLSIDSKLLKVIQKLDGASLTGFEIPEERWTSEAIEASEEERPIFLPNYAKLIAPLFSNFDGRIVEQGLKLAGISQATKGAYLPMQIGAEAQGFLTIWGDDLREADLPAFNVFTGQVSSILEKARLYEAEQRQAKELERSNALVNALGRVAAQVASGNQLDVVLDTLGQELESLGISFSYSTIDKERETEVIQHLSADSKVLKAINKMAGFSLFELEFPLHDWPTDMLAAYKQGLPFFIENYAEELLKVLPDLNIAVIERGLQLVGISPATSALHIPLQLGNASDQMLSVWGDTLREEDLPAFTVFASQVSSTLTNAQLYETERKQAKELERSNTLVNALGRVAAQVASSNELDVVLDTLGDELSDLDLYFSYSFIDHKKDTAAIRYLSMDSKVIDAIKKIAGASILELELPRSNWLPDIRQAYENGNAVYTKSFADVMRSVLPDFNSRIIEKGLELAGISSSTSALHIPLQLGGSSEGFLSVWGDALHQSDLPAFTVFASQVGSTLKTARLYSAEQQQAAELERSNSLVNLLSSVAASISSTNNAEEILQILGKQFQALGIESLVTLIRSDRQTLNIHYVSYNANLLKKVKKLTGVTVEGYEIPREVWPEPTIRVFEHNEIQFIDSFPDFVSPYFPHLPEKLVKSGLKLLGVTEQTSSFYLPMSMDGQTFGSLTIWGESLRQEDSSAYTVFASQLASVFESARLYEAEQQQAAELERSNSLVNALSSVAASVSSTNDPDDILENLGKELQNLRLECLLSLLKPDKQSFYIGYVSYNSKLIKQLEKVTGLSASKYELPREKWPEGTLRLYDHNEPQFVASFADTITPYFPHAPEKMVKRGLHMLGMTEETAAVYLPMCVDGQVIGSLTILGEALHEDDLTAFSVFAAQLSSVYESARLYEAEQKQATELARSNALFSALNNVGVKIAATTDADEVLETLGTELKELGLNCVAMTLSHDRQDAVIHSISLDSPLLEKVEKFAGLSAVGISVNRATWASNIKSLYDEGRPAFVPDFLSATVQVVDLIPRKILEQGMKMSGMTPDTRAIFVPLTADNTVFGSLCIWGQDLHESDLAAFTVFANQVGSVFENARLYESERQQATELERSNQLVDALSRISARIAETNDPEAVFAILGQELKYFQMGCTISFVELDRQSTRMVYISLSTKMMHKLGDLAGIQLDDRRVSREIWTNEYQYLIDNGQPFFVEDYSQSVIGYFPDVSKTILHQGLKMIGINSETSALVLPLDVHGELFGTISIWGQDLRETDMHSFSVFSRQVAGVFENARLYEAERWQADSLERSNAMLTALNDVAARISATFDTDEVLETLGDSLSQLRLDSVVALLDPVDRALVFRYYSIDSALLPQAEKLVGISLQDYRLPVEELPPIMAALFRERQALYAPSVHSLGSSFFKHLPSKVMEKGMQLVGISKETSAILVPLEIDGHATGFIGVWGESPQQADVPTFSIFANQVASSLENARLYAAEQRQIQRLNALRTIDQAISSSHDEHAVFQTVLEQVATQLAVDAAAILLFRPSTNALEFVAGRGLQSDAIQTSSVPISDNGLGHLGFDRRLIQLPDISRSPNGFKDDARLAAEGACAYFAAPLIVDRQIKGLLEVYHRQPLNPDEEWLDFLETLAGQAAIAMDNTQLFDSLQQSNTSLLQAYNATLEGWAKALELRDNETEGHSQRVTEMVVRLSRHLGLSEDAIVEVRRGALLHDIGKMGIPDSILHKPGPLDDGEWEIMRRHPVHAFELLSRIPYLSAALDIPYCHHEKWNGGGYPRGLEGEQIPLAARIFAVIDVYDALRSDRPYRKAWSEEKTLAYIAEESGQHFDPVVVDAFLQMMEDHPSENVPVPVKRQRT
ncbi:MAG: PAS domain S-box protein [Chloroflexi bacterium]|nr:MAG: PAS domain S-box protein [Chloroflexota bacterium]MBL1196373.1 PAS domain S-box protein [Chloroflexota bacterium]NOH13668.1 PAS domain S-box protein [Chloroflexota bacterium]